ncbi:MAG: DUF4168 domain-containing protein [Acaryochloris sp. RU_4_1]|nr:DUF4168 domain-containing protein [Acaryochloris sp. RU_4_1]NJR55099.1 DUF4168 domain-containing protein [Acaryochloris sp. CRU_2_0]
MNAHKYLSILRIFPTLLSLTTLSVLASLPVLASQSSFSTQNSELFAQANATDTTTKKNVAEGSTDKPTVTPTTSDSVPSNSSDASKLGNTTEAGTPKTPETPAVNDTSAETTTSGETPTTLKAPTVKPPVFSPPSTTPPVVAPNPKGETSQAEGNAPDATTPPAGATPPAGETPTAPAEEASPPAPTTAPTAPEQPASSTPDTPDADAAKPGSDQTTPLKITETELKQFATAIPPLSVIEKTTKGEVDQVIGQSGLSKDQFIALSKTPTAEVTPAEKKSFEQAMTKIQVIEQKAQAEQEKIIRAKGFEPQRFTEILAAVRQDPNLRTKVQQMLPPQ